MMNLTWKRDNTKDPTTMGLQRDPTVPLQNPTLATWKKDNVKDLTTMGLQRDPTVRLLSPTRVVWKKDSVRDQHITGLLTDLQMTTPPRIIEDAMDQELPLE